MFPALNSTLIAENQSYKVTKCSSWHTVSSQESVSFLCLLFFLFYSKRFHFHWGNEACPMPQPPTQEFFRNIGVTEQVKQKRVMKEMTSQVESNCPWFKEVMCGVNGLHKTSKYSTHIWFKGHLTVKTQNVKIRRGKANYLNQPLQRTDEEIFFLSVMWRLGLELHFPNL